MFNPFTYLSDFIFPPFCVLTNNKLKENEIIFSNSILYKFEIAGNPNFIKEAKNDVLIKKDINFVNIFSLFANFDEVQELIHYIKYSKYKEIGYIFGRHLGKKIKQESILNYDLIIPVPLHKVKKRSRGFNQAFEIGKGVAEVLNCEVNDKIMIRKRFTITQTKLNSEERKKNLENVFTLNFELLNKVEGKNILIVDDVFTTGSTINSLAKEINKYKPNIIDCATITLA